MVFCVTESPYGVLAGYFDTPRLSCDDDETDDRKGRGRVIVVVSDQG